MNKVLIDAGRSSFGWSRIGTFSRCPQLFAYGQRLNLEMIPAHALTRGSMGHILQAHQHAIWGAATAAGVWVDETWYDDPSVFLDPETAVQMWCDTNGGHEHLDRMLETFRRYMAKHPEPPGDVLKVEYPVTSVIGHKDGQWGLWVVDFDHARFDRSEKTVKAWDGKIIQPTPLNMPGHKDNGKAILLTRRLDMVSKERGGRTFIWDHKHQARVSLGRSVDGYAIDGGFAAFRIMGKQMYGSNFGGLMLNLIQTQSPWRIARPVVPNTPHRDHHFAAMLWREEHRLAQLEIENPTFWDWPKVQHETTCIGRYGACPGLKFCFYGSAAETL
mgnify:CR=1 FL=1